jgi:PAS domain S-box-containing protein
MNKNPLKDLRRLVEKKPESQLINPSKIRMKKLVHELNIEQVKLENQNKKLKQSQEELMAAKQKYTKLYESAPVGYLELDKKGTILRINVTGRKLIKKTGLVGSSLSQYVSQEDADKLYLYFRQLYKTKKKNTICCVRLKTSNIDVQLESTIVGKFCHSIMSDVTKQKKLESATRDSEYRYKSVTDHTGMMAYDYDLVSGNLLLFGSIRKVLGYSKKELGHINVKKWTSMVHPDDRKEVFIRLDKAQKKCERYDEVYRVRHKNGRYVYVEDHGAFVPDKNGKAYRMFGSVINVDEKKQYQKKINKERFKFLELFNNIPVLSYNISLQGKIIDINNFALKVLGYKRSELVEKQVLKLYSPKSQLKAKKLFNKWKRLKKLKNEEMQVITKKGKLLDVLLNVDTVYNDHGQVLNTISTHTDITEKKKAEESLKASEEYIRTINENITDAIFAKDKEGRYTFVNPAASKMMGLPSKKIIGRTAKDIFSRKNAQAIKIVDDKNLKGQRVNKISRMEIGGKVIFLNTSQSPMYDADKKIVGITGVVKDVTQQKKAEESLKESEDTLSTVLDTFPEGIDIVDENLNILWMSKSFTKMFGKGSIGKKCYKFLKDNKKQCDRCPSKKPLKVGETHKIVIGGVAGGRIFEISHTGMNLKGRKVILEVFRDITEKQKIEEELYKSFQELKIDVSKTTQTLAQSTKKLRNETRKRREIEDKIASVEKLAALGKLAGILGHELRNPISTIRHSIYYLKMRDLKDETINKHIRFMEEEAVNSERIINDVLLFAKIGKPRKSKLNINKHLELIIKSIIIPDTVKVKFKFDNLPNIYMDVLHLRQVIQNLISNSVSAMISGGTITITTVQKNHDIQIEVIDTGKGIPVKNIQHIFEPLFSTYYKGTGLGLPVCRQVLSIYDGTIEVESQIKQGTKFTIKIPIKGGK